MDARTLGSFGEEQAARYLRRKGYRIVERNFRCAAGAYPAVQAVRKADETSLRFVAVRTEGALTSVFCVNPDKSVFLCHSPWNREQFFEVADAGMKPADFIVQGNDVGLQAA